MYKIVWGLGMAYLPYSITKYEKEITFGELVPINRDSVPHFVTNDNIYYFAYLKTLNP